MCLRLSHMHFARLGILPVAKCMMMSAQMQRQAYAVAGEP